MKTLLEKEEVNFSYSSKRRANYYKIDGRLITGQDPSAAASVAQKIVEVLAKQRISNL